MKYIKIICLFFLGSTILFGCKKEKKTVIPNEEELITTLRYNLVPSGGGATVQFTFTDLDGDGGNAPAVVGGTLMANTTYNGSIELLNETETPAEDITLEVQEEDEEHQFFFESLDGLAATMNYADQDGNGQPLGLKSTLVTSGASSGKVRIILRHEPNKTAQGVSGGDITNAGGETDIEVEFPVTIQ